MSTRAPGERPSAARGAVMVVGTTGGAGTSTAVTALCRALARRGLRVAPFQGEHLADHVAVTPDGGQIGHAQAVQALAARATADRRMGPVVLTGYGEDASRVVVLGDEVLGDTDGYADPARRRRVVLDALSSLRREHDLVVLEGAGPAGETTPPERHAVNLPLAAAAGVPAVLVANVDRGQSLASAYGTWALLPEHLRGHLRGFVLTCFRGDAAELADDLCDLERRTGVPVLGVLPHLGDRMVPPVEELPDPRQARAAGPGVSSPVRVAAVRLPHLTNPSDLDPLLLEPSLEVRWVTRPQELEDADLVVLPSSRSTLDDLAWLRGQGLDRALAGLDRRIRLFGIGSGYQMLGGLIRDDSAPGAGTVEGLGLLPVETTLEPPKVVCRSRGRFIGTEIPVEGYQIRWGQVRRLGGHPLFELDGAAGDGDGDGVELEGCVSDRHVRGTSLHGVMDCDRLRQALLWKVATARGRTFVPSPRPFGEAFDAHVERLADWVEDHLDVDGVLGIAGEAVAPGQEPGW